MIYDLDAAGNVMNMNCAVFFNICDCAFICLARLWLQINWLRSQAREKENRRPYAFFSFFILPIVVCWTELAFLPGMSSMQLFSQISSYYFVVI